MQKLLELHHAAGSGSVCVIVQGSSGCGKSTLLRSYAHTCGYKDGENLLVIHLGEQIDSKVYICIYICVWLCMDQSSAPGLETGHRSRECYIPCKSLACMACTPHHKHKHNFAPVNLTRNGCQSLRAVK